MSAFGSRLRKTGHNSKVTSTGITSADSQNPWNMFACCACAACKRANSVAMLAALCPAAVSSVRFKANTAANQVGLKAVWYSYR